MTATAEPKGSDPLLEPTVLAELPRTGKYCTKQTLRAELGLTPSGGRQALDLRIYRAGPAGEMVATSCFIRLRVPNEVEVLKRALDQALIRLEAGSQTAQDASDREDRPADPGRAADAPTGNGGAAGGKWA